MSFSLSCTCQRTPINSCGQSFAPTLARQSRVLHFNGLAGKLANLTTKFANFCSPNGLDALLSETDLLGCRGVASDLAQGRMSADRHDDGGGATCFRQPTTGRLAQPMRGRAGWQTGCLTFALEPMGKGVRVKWFSSVRHQERQVLGRRAAPGAVGSLVACRSCFDGHAAGRPEDADAQAAPHQHDAVRCISSAKARRAREPIGYLASKAAMSPSVQL
jgi:hypothetical protein